MDIPLRSSVEECVCCNINSHDNDDGPSLDDYKMGTIKLIYNNNNSNNNNDIYVPTIKNNLLVVERRNE